LSPPSPIEPEPELDEELGPPLETSEASAPPEESDALEEPESPVNPEELGEPDEVDPVVLEAPELEADEFGRELDGALTADPELDPPPDPESALPPLSLLPNGLSVELVLQATVAVCAPMVTASSKGARMIAMPRHRDQPPTPQGDPRPPARLRNAA
jgi:hypothetical protein